MLDQHLWTTLHVAQAVVPGMVERGFGRVIAVSSPLAADPGPKGASYAVAKAAEEALVRSLAREVSGSGVTANLVLVRTLDPNHERETAPTAKNASWATPEEVAETMAFLASPAAAAVNGARIPLYGRSLTDRHSDGSAVHEGLGRSSARVMIRRPWVPDLRRPVEAQSHAASCRGRRSRAIDSGATARQGC